MSAINKAFAGAGLSAALLGGAANAADLPFAEPVEYVKVCDAYGKGFFYIPGTDTCLKIAGLVRADYRWEDDEFLPGGNDFYTDIRGRLQADARSETEWGTLRSFIEFEGRADSTGGGASSTAAAPAFPNGNNPTTVVRQAFIQFAGVTAGHLSRSLYDYVPYKIIGDQFSDERVNTLAYTGELTKGVEFTIGLEDKYFRANPYDFAGVGESELDQKYPNGIAALVVKQGWGDAKVAAAVQDNVGDTGFDGDDDSDQLGWAVQGGLSVNIPGAIKGSKVYVQGAYTEGALSYIGAEDFGASSNFRNDTFGGGQLRDTRLNGAGDLLNTEAFSVGGGASYFWTKEVQTNLAAIYVDVDPGADEYTAYNYFLVEGNVVWSPVENLELWLAVQYGRAEIDEPGVGASTGPGEPASPDEEDHFGVITRVARTF